MRKLLFSVLVVMSMFAFGCRKGDATPKIEHHEMQAPASARLVGLQCDRPCALFFDMETGAYVMQYFDGSTYKVLPPDVTQ